MKISSSPVLLGGFGEKKSNGGNPMVFSGQGLLVFRNGRRHFRERDAFVFDGGMRWRLGR